MAQAAVVLREKRRREQTRRPGPNPVQFHPDDDNISSRLAGGITPEPQWDLSSQRRVG